MPGRRHRRAKRPVGLVLRKVREADGDSYRTSLPTGVRYRSGSRAEQHDDVAVGDSEHHGITGKCTLGRYRDGCGCACPTTFWAANRTTQSALRLPMPCLPARRRGEERRAERSAGEHDKMGRERTSRRQDGVLTSAARMISASLGRCAEFLPGGDGGGCCCGRLGRRGRPAAFGSPGRARPPASPCPVSTATSPPQRSPPAARFIGAQPAE